VTDAEGKETELAATNVVLATGSDPMDLPGVAIDEKRIVSSTGALALAKVPKRLIVVGGGYIGLELGSVWRRLGSEVQVVEFLDRIVPGMDGEIAKNFQRMLKKQGLSFHLSSKVTGAKATKAGVELDVEPAEGDEARTLEADVVLVAIGRRPHTEGLGLERAGVARDRAGRIQVDGRFQTNVAGIYAIGDVIEGPMLAHKAEEEGVALAEMLAGQSGHVNYETVPGIVYTWPEVAAVGKTEEQLEEAPLFSQQPGARQRRHRGLRQDPGRCRDRPHPGRPHHRPRRRHPDPRGGADHGIRRLGRGPGAILPRPSDPQRGGQGSGARGGGPRHPHVTPGAVPDRGIRTWSGARHRRKAPARANRGRPCPACA
jgi:pyruvate/2-oxoglutarate dehydrogenase complex dihydrolipoamide dehydrogenase (E3) component